MKMTEEKKTTKKAQPPKAAKAEAGAPKRAPAKKAAVLKAPQTAQAPKSGKTLVVKQVGSPACSESWVYQTLKGLGLGKINRVRTLEDTPAVRGMINRVHHLVKIQDAA